MNDGLVCKKCGTKNDNNSTYCLYCGGFLLSNIDSNLKNDTEEVKPKKYTFAVILSLIVISIGATLLLGLYGLFPSIAVLLLYLIFGNSKLFKGLLYIIAGLVGLVILAFLLFIVYGIVSIIVGIASM